MKFEIENELLPAGRPQNGRRNTVMKACTAVICVLLIVVYVKLEFVNREDKGLGNEPGWRGPDKGQGASHWEGSQSGEPGLPGPTGPKGKTGPFGPAGSLGGVETSSEGNGIVEGIIAGTSSGVVIIRLDSREQRTIPSKHANGVAFNWQSRKVYWIEIFVGIKIADLDGSNAELIISNNNLRGLAVDQITGNVYYGELGSNSRIRVCDSMGKKCATWGFNIGGYYIWDIVLFPSDGLMFWSGPFDEKSVTRANMDGTNATKLILENVSSLYLDDFTEKLYWVDFGGNSIGQSDFNGYNGNVLLNPTIINPRDLAVDGDKLYFGGFSPDGVYFATSNRQVSSLSNTTGKVWQITLFGRNKVFSRPNPCSNSPCANLCVLTRVSYTCL